MKSLVISAHSISANEQTKIAQELNSEPTFFSLFELKQFTSKKQIIQTLLSFRNQDVVVFLNFDNSDLLKGFLFIIPLMCLKLRFRVIEKGGKLSSATFLSSFAEMLRMGWTTVTNFVLMAFFQILSLFLSNRTQKTSQIDYLKFKKCLYIKSNFWFGIPAGGSVGHVAGVANALSRVFQVTYLTVDNPVMLSDKMKIKKIERRYRFSFPYELNNLGFNLSFFHQMKEFKEVDFYYQRMSLFNFSGAFFSKIFKKPFILEYNGSEVWIQSNWSSGLKYPRLANAIEKFNLKCADTVVVVSEALREQLVNEGIPESKIVFYPNCIDPDVYNSDVITDKEKTELRQTLRIKPDDFVFTFVGTFGPWHGVEFLVEGINNFFLEMPSSNVKFLLIGDGVLRKKCESILRPEFREDVIFTGMIPQSLTPKYLAFSDCFISPHTKKEGEKFFGSPTKLFEYMSVGKPVVASSLEQIGQLFDQPFIMHKRMTTDGKTDGFLFEPNNQNEFLDLLKHVVRMPKNELSEAGLNSRKLAISKYTWDKHVDVILRHNHKH